MPDRITRRRHAALFAAAVTGAAVVVSVLLAAALQVAVGSRDFAFGIVLAVVVPLLVAPGPAYWLASAMVELNRARAEMREQLRYDSLTGVCTRRYFYELLEQEIARCRRHGIPVSVLLADLDHFKRINDRYGHHAGDAALRRFAAVVRALVRTSDIVGRLGGEEFALVMPHCPSAEAQHSAERLSAAVEANHLEYEGHRIVLTVSIGVATLAVGEDADALMRGADQALYAAKNAGRNRVAVRAVAVVA